MFSCKGFTRRLHSCCHQPVPGYHQPLPPHSASYGREEVKWIQCRTGYGEDEVGVNVCEGSLVSQTGSNQMDFEMENVIKFRKGGGWGGGDYLG